MSRLKRSVPSLGALVTFEAAARVGGFTKAANELGVTQAAVSRQIRILEDHLGTALFVRMPRQVVLTDAGTALAATLEDAFARIVDSVEDIKSARETETLTIGATLASSHFWLLPRLPNFRAGHPDLDLRVLTQDIDFDMQRRDVDVLLRYGKAPFRDGRVVASLPETVFPVCSPGYLATHGDRTSLNDHVLIESESPHRAWLKWHQWSGRLRRPLAEKRRTLRFNHYSDAVYAAINGEGIALGWKRLLARPLSDGRLVRFGTAELLPGEGHHVIVASGREPNAAVESYVAWMVQCFEEAANDD